MQSLPYFETVSSAFRWFLIWILPIALMVTWVLRALPVAVMRPLVLVSIPLVIVFAEWHAPAPWQPYDPSTIVTGYRAVQAGEGVPAVTHLAESLVDGKRRYVTGAGDVLVRGGSQLVCNEPVFGYVLEHFRFDRVGQGPTRAMTQFGVNFYRPECFLYPETNLCQAGDVFESVEDPGFRSLLAYEDYPFDRPMIASIAVLVSQGAFVAVCLIFLVIGVAAAWRLSRHRDQEQHRE